MKKMVLVLTIVLFAQSVAALNRFELQGGASIGGLNSGKQKELFSSSLTPVPTGFTYMGWNLNFKYFPTDYFGLMVGALNGGLTVQSSKTKGLRVLNLTNLEGGISGRFPFYYEDILKATFNFNTGINTSKIDYDSAYTGLLPAGYYLFNINPELGFFVESGFQLYTSENIFLGMYVKYYKSNGRINSSGLDFEGLYFVVPVFVGISI